MKRISVMLAAISLTINSIACFAAETKTAPPSTQFQPSIDWQTDFKSALSKAQTNHQPVLLLFTGSDWCSWCRKLEDEILKKREFSDAVGNRFIFVKVDFPMRQKLPQQIADQNQELKKRYNISSFPTIVILDEQGKVIGNTGYREGGPTQFARHLQSLVGK